MKWLSALVGFVAGRRLVSSKPQSLLIGFAVIETATLIFSFAGNPLGGFLSVVAGFVLAALGIRCGGGPVRCFICGFFQFFFVLGILVVPGSEGAYFMAHLLSIAYPLLKALL